MHPLDLEPGDLVTARNTNGSYQGWVLWERYETSASGKSGSVMHKEVAIVINNLDGDDESVYVLSCRNEVGWVEAKLLKKL